MIKKARRVRKVMGGGMRQAGFLAAAGSYALKHHVDRLAKDNSKAHITGEVLAGLAYVEMVRPVQSNIVIFDLAGTTTAADFLATLAAEDILATAFGPQTVRLTFHLHITDEMLERLITILQKLTF